MSRDVTSLRVSCSVFKGTLSVQQPSSWLDVGARGHRTSSRHSTYQQRKSSRGCCRIKWSISFHVGARACTRVGEDEGGRLRGRRLKEIGSEKLERLSKGGVMEGLETDRELALGGAGV